MRGQVNQAEPRRNDQEGEEYTSTSCQARSPAEIRLGGPKGWRANPNAVL